MTMNDLINTIARMCGVQYALTPVPRPVLYFTVRLYHGPRDWRIMSEHRSRFIAELYAAEWRDTHGENLVQVQPVIRIIKLEPEPVYIPPVKRWIG